LSLTCREQAAFYRAALLLGLLRGDVVVGWADDLIARDESPSAALVEIATTPPDDLTMLRQRLLAIGDEKESAAVVGKLLGLVQRDLTSGRRTFKDTMTVLKQLRGFLKLDPALNDQLKTLGLGVALAAAGSTDAAIAEQRVREWLEQQ
jgi:hypothetical protein